MKKKEMGWKERKHCRFEIIWAGIRSSHQMDAFDNGSYTVSTVNDSTIEFLEGDPGLENLRNSNVQQCKIEALL